MNNSQETANLIKSLAKLKGVSISKLLLDCELNKNALYTMQSNGYFPRVEALAKIADYLDISVDYLLGRTETTRVINIPDKIIDIITEEYNKNPKEFISDEFIKSPNKTMKNQVYSFYDYYYNDYINIFDEAYNYANDNNIDMGNVAGIESKKEYMEMINIHDDFIPRMIIGKYYTLTQADYNKFCEVYKLYTKAYKDYVKNLLDNAE